MNISDALKHKVSLCIETNDTAATFIKIYEESVNQNVKLIPANLLNEAFPCKNKVVVSVSNNTVKDRLLYSELHRVGIMFIIVVKDISKVPQSVLDRSLIVKEQ